MRIANSGPKVTGAGKYYTSLFITILFITCFLILICNWWNLSAENLELLRQTNNLQEELRIGIEERDKCNQLQSSFEERIKKLEDELAFIHVQLKKDSIQVVNNVTNDEI